MGHDTFIVVPGSFATGTNHVAHSGSAEVSAVAGRVQREFEARLGLDDRVEPTGSPDFTGTTPTVAE